MTYIGAKGVDVFFDNGHRCGKIIFNEGWGYHNFISDNNKQSFNDKQLIEIAKLLHKMDRMKK